MARARQVRADKFEACSWVAAKCSHFAANTQNLSQSMPVATRVVPVVGSRAHVAYCA